MYVNLKEEFICSKCGRENHVEHFSNSDGRGIRCRNCGHEKLNHRRIDPMIDGETAWIKQDRITKF